MLIKYLYRCTCSCMKCSAAGHDPIGTRVLLVKCISHSAIYSFYTKAQMITLTLPLRISFTERRRHHRLKIELRVYFLFFSFFSFWGRVRKIRQYTCSLIRSSNNFTAASAEQRRLSLDAYVTAGSG